MKATGSVFLLGWLLLAHSVLASSPQSRIEDEEYRVYDSLIPKKFLNKKERGVVIENRTTFNAGDDLIFLKTQPDLTQRLATLDERYEILGHQLGGISLEILKDFRAKDSRPYEITPRHRLTAKYVLLSKKRVITLFQQWQGDWNYPHTIGVISFSRVGFNAAKTEAIVYVRFSCGRRCSSSEFVFLSKTQQEWRKKSSYVTLQS